MKKCSLWVLLAVALLMNTVGLVDGFATSQYHALCECDGRPVAQAAADAFISSS